VEKYVDVVALGRVLVLSLVVGAGLPALFALGVRALAPVDGKVRPVRAAAGWLCFAVCLGAVALGVVKLVLGGH